MRKILLPQNIKYFRAKCHMTQKQLADVVGSNSRTISHYEMGDRSINLDILVKLAKFFNVTIEELVFDEH